MYEQKVIIPEQLKLDLANAWAHNRVIIMSAFCGYGKTSIAESFLARYKVCKGQVRKGERLDLDASVADEVIFIEDLQLLKDRVEIDKLYHMICNRVDLKFLFTTRGTVPEWLLPLQFEGIVKLVKESDLRFGLREVYRCAEDAGVTLSREGTNKILEKSKGYPLGIRAFIHSLSEGGVWGEHANARVKWEIFGYIDQQLFQELELDEQRFLLKMAPFSRFSVDLAQNIVSDCNTRKIIEGLLLDTTILLHTGEDEYEFNSVLRAFILWKFHKDYSEEEKQAIYLQGGSYYEAHEDIMKALSCYENAKAYDKITELLTSNAMQNPAVGHYLEMEKYYLNMPREQVLKSPSLMCGMSMLMSMRAHYDKSDEWYHELVQYSLELKKRDPEYTSVIEMIIYLDIALPQKRTDGLIDMINKLIKHVGNGHIKLPPFSITSRLPSVLNGGKDFSEWSKNDEMLYKTFRVPLNKILKDEGIGATECGMCESRFEKGKDYGPYLVKMMSILPDVQQRGTPDIEFAIIGTIARIHISQGKAENAKQSLLVLRERYTESKEIRFLPNIDAMLAHIVLLQGDDDSAVQWKEKNAPKANDSIWTMWRYQYFIKIEVLIYEREYVDALLLLTQLRIYTQKCHRIIDEIQVHCLMAICYYRMGDKEWKRAMQVAISMSETYQFINTVAQFGVAVLPLLTSGRWKGDKEFLGQILKAARTHATFYQEYLNTRMELTEKLSGMELSVLRLICQNKSNQEVCEILGIKLPTVKTHASNIYRKLGVNRRAEAKAEAIRRNLVEEYI